MPPTTDGSVMYCTFRVGELYLGIEAALVQEVLREALITPAPLAPPAVKGLINLRGQIVTAIDLGIKLGRAPARRQMHVVVRTDAEAVSLLVDSIEDVVALRHADHAPVPSTVDAVAASHLLATGALSTDLLLVLDADKVVTPG